MTQHRDRYPTADAPRDLPADPGTGELAALRARLRDVEAALGLPARPGQPAAPTFPALLRRVAALERRAGLVPGLLPLPGCGPLPAVMADSTPPSRSRRQVWLGRGQVLLATALLVALLAWLLRPLPTTRPSAEAVVPTPTALLRSVAAPPAPAAGGAAVPPGVWGRDESCPNPDARVCWEWGGAPAGFPGQPPAAGGGNTK